MNTLFNVGNRRDEINPPNDGFTSGVILEIQSPEQGKNSHGGGSFYVPIDNHQWFVFRATYNRVEKELDSLKKNVAHVYLPKHYVLKQINGKKKPVLESLLPDLVSVNSTQKHLERMFRENKELRHYHFYRDKTKKINQFDDKHPLIVASHHDMSNFIKPTSIKSEHIKLVNPEHCHYKYGDLRIVDGKFSGIERRVARITGQQHVVIEIEGIYMVATAYVPSAFICKLNKPEKNRTDI